VELTTENTALVLDSTADDPGAPDRHPNVRVVPLYVRFGEESFRDYVDLGPEEFYARLRTAPELPTTSQPTPQDFLSTYEALAGYDRILSLQISSKLSGTYQSAQLAAEQAGDGRVRVIDSRTASVAIAMLGNAILRRLERGTTDDEIDALVASYADVATLLFTVDTLEFLARGGRIGKARAMAGNLLHIKPILSLQDGEIEPIKRVRGNQKAFMAFVEQFRAGTREGDGLRVGIAHADAPERAQSLVEMVQRERSRATIEIVTTLGAVVGTHAGPGTIGFFWFEDA
jgi:DegV family protein with EDD domain